MIANQRKLPGRTTYIPVTSVETQHPHQQNIPYVNWNCLTGDAETRNPVPADLIEKAKKTAKTASSDSLILLMHDAGAKQASADALPGIIEAFRKEGYRFDTLKRK